MIHYLALAYVFLVYPSKIFAFLCVAASNLALKQLCGWAHRKYNMPQMLRPYSRKSGMPSGHCQVFCSVAMFVALREEMNFQFKLALLALALLVCEERVYSEKHTRMQVGVGACLGILCGTCVHVFT